MSLGMCVVRRNFSLYLVLICAIFGLELSMCPGFHMILLGILQTLAPATRFQKGSCRTAINLINPLLNPQRVQFEPKRLSLKEHRYFACSVRIFCIPISVTSFQSRVHSCDLHILALKSGYTPFRV